MQHFAPHPSAAFEGYYSKFDLPSGAKLALIICSVPAAPTLPHMLSFTYVPGSRTRTIGSSNPTTATIEPAHPPTPIYQQEIWVPQIHRIPDTGPDHAFELRIPNVGYMHVDADGTTTYDLRCPPHFTFHARTRPGTRVPWDPAARFPILDTPEGPLALPPLGTCLPLRWHVHSLGSVADFDLTIPDPAEQQQAAKEKKKEEEEEEERTVDDRDDPSPPAGVALHPHDRRGTATVHQEKNWASSFPDAHIWIQARDAQNEAHICLAGGRILGLDAYLLQWQPRRDGSSGGGGGDATRTFTFRPPFTLAFPLGGHTISPFAAAMPHWSDRSFDLTVTVPASRRLRVRATGPAGSFFGLASPFPDGHRTNFLGQSFAARVEATAWEWEWECGWAWLEEDEGHRQWWAWPGRFVSWLLGAGRWTEVAHDVFENASLEFGGGYYGEAGTAKGRN